MKKKLSSYLCSGHHAENSSSTSVVIYTPLLYTPIILYKNSTLNTNGEKGPWSEVYCGMILWQVAYCDGFELNVRHGGPINSTEKALMRGRWCNSCIVEGVGAVVPEMKFGRPITEQPDTQVILF